MALRPGSPCGPLGGDRTVSGPCRDAARGCAATERRLRKIDAAVVVAIAMVAGLITSLSAVFRVTFSIAGKVGALE
jgi:uncharacterized membrane protein (UPF0182 family)